MASLCLFLLYTQVYIRSVSNGGFGIEPAGCIPFCEPRPVRGWRVVAMRGPARHRTRACGPGLCSECQPCRETFIWEEWWRYCSSALVHFEGICYYWKNSVVCCFCSVFFFTCGSTVDSFFPSGNSRFGETCHIPWLNNTAHKVLSERKTFASLVKNARIRSCFCDLNFADT